MKKEGEGGCSLGGLFRRRHCERNKGVGRGISVFVSKAFMGAREGREQDVQELSVWHSYSFQNILWDPREALNSDIDIIRSMLQFHKSVLIQAPFICLSLRPS